MVVSRRFTPGIFKICRYPFMQFIRCKLCFITPPPGHVTSHRSRKVTSTKFPLTCFVELIHFCKAFHRTGQNACAPCVSAHFKNASSPDSLVGNLSSLKKRSRDLRTSLNLRTALSSSWIPVYFLASSFAYEEREM